MKYRKIKELIQIDGRVSILPQYARKEEISIYTELQ